MKAVKIIEGRAYPLPMSNIDTDLIIPARFLKAVTRDGLGAGAFETLKARQDSVFNDPRFNGAPILLAGQNFGCGSSREHAVWALMEMGIRAIIAESFSDIFASNAAANGLLLVALEKAAVGELVIAAQRSDIRVNLENRTVLADGDMQFQFDVDATVRRNLLLGIDPIGVTMTSLARIESFEQMDDPSAPWLRKVDAGTITSCPSG